MVFSSPVFVFLFLPVLLLLYTLTHKSLHNLLLLFASLFFYAWGEPICLILMVISMAFNYRCGLLLAAWRGTRLGGWILGVGIFVNIGSLIYFKYANFLLAMLINPLLSFLHLPEWTLGDVRLPIGISFFAFHAVSYLMEVYRGHANVQRDPVDFGLYIALFPTLVAGPIVNYADFEGQLKIRHITRDGFAYGIKRFTLGLAKKLLIANIVGRAADLIFALPMSEINAGLAWLGIVCYTLQIYFDFSGYSDMAVGLGRLFGFRLIENFQYPYVSKSITEFWRRWHISLSTWFREYLYIPLGGNRHGPFRTALNLLTVFLLCGLWHGESKSAWNFIVWGLFHGAFLVLDRVGVGKLLERVGAPLRHAYTILVVMVGWVFFRAASVPLALHFLKALAGFGEGTGREFNVKLYLNLELALAIAAGIIFSTPVLPTFLQWRERFLHGHRDWPVLNRSCRAAFAFVAVAVFLALQSLAVVQLIASTYNPFIYYRF